MSAVKQTGGTGMSEATLRQVRAADPAGSAWVSANAGSGKTRVLTDRVARLLLAGARPEKILCLTYTRAAAAEMQERLFSLLGGWAMMEDDALREALQARSEEALELSDAALARARTLFASALETPGGLKIQTIHAFCEKLLRRFPLEAGISPRFEVLDDRAAAQIMAAIRDRMARAAEEGSDPSFDAAARRVSEFTLDALDAEALAKRALFTARDGAEADAALAAAFELPEGLKADGLLDEAVAAHDPDAIAELIPRFAAGGKTAQKKVPDLKAAEAAWKALLDGAHATEEERQAQIRRFLLSAEAALLTRTLSIPKTVVTKGMEAETPGLTETFHAAAEGALRAREALNLSDALARSQDLRTYAAALIAGYEAEKESRSALDFADLVTRAGALLSSSAAASWALYKLDGGVDHILIDEAQDTAPDQWAVIRAVAEEFFAGAGARPGDAPRTLFVVGDEKQSIYSFQGAEPREFGRMRAHFDDRLAAAPRPLHVGELAHSFRSAPAILEFADKVFEGRAEGLSAEGADPRHVAAKTDAPGLIELWPFFGREEEGEEPAWDDPIDAPAPRAPKARLAEAVAAHVATLLEEGEPIPLKKNGRFAGWRPMRPGDVMILVRSRAGLAPGMIRGLKARGVDVAGADRMLLTAELAVKDLLALLRVAQDPGDDLALAALLRSPLGGLDEDGLYEIARARGGRLIDALAAAPEAAPGALDMVRGAIARADYQRPHEILSRALVDHGGRAALLARLGPEAEDAIDELLAQSLAYERAETPTLAGFLAWLDAAAGTEVKREQGGGADEVRVMTVHGAKGLEAPFVILPDAGPVRGARAPGILALDGPGGPVPAWPVKAAERPAPMQAAFDALEEKERQERDRLLYVALTRAEDRLLIAGGGEADKAEDSWWGMARQALEALGAEEAPRPPALAKEAEAEAPMLRRGPLWSPPASVEAPAAAPRPGAHEPPLPADRIAADRVRPDAPPAPIRRIAASALAPDGAGMAGGDAAGEDAAGRPGAPLTPPAAPLDRETARRRGIVVHDMLERLAALPEAARPEAAASLARAATALPAAQRDGCAAEALAALALPELAPFLGPNSLAEAGFSAEARSLGGRLVGRIDRLAFDAAGRILLLDWKTGPAPARGALPGAYLNQLAAYALALEALTAGDGGAGDGPAGDGSAGAPVAAHILWTAEPRLDRIADADLAAAVAALKERG